MKQLTDQTIIKYNEIRYNQIESDREFGTSKKGKPHSHLGTKGVLS